jgi:hypothetical protein
MTSDSVSALVRISGNLESLVNDRHVVGVTAKPHNRHRCVMVIESLVAHPLRP